MRAPDCTACGRVVLELEGQFEVLDSYYIEDGAPPPTTAGVWHLRCLRDSPHGEAWYAARRRNCVEVRRFEATAVGAWTVLRNPNTGDALALAGSGELCSLVVGPAAPRRCPGGAIYRVEEDYNLELDDGEAIAAIRDGLAATKVFSLLAVHDLLGIADCVVHPEALADARFHRLRDHGRRFIATRAEYGVFVPGELRPFVTRTRARRR